MKKITIFILIICAFSIFSSCKKTKLTGDFAKYEGTWDGAYTTLDLRSNGRGDYDYEKDNATKYIHGGRIIISGSTLKIKLMLISKKFTIKQEPITVTDPNTNVTKTYMQLDDEILVKQ